MKVLAYAGGEFLTGTQIAHALLDYSQALADVGTAASIEIPIVGDDGRPAHATFLVGPASQIVAIDVLDSVEELEDDAVVERLKSLTRALHPVALPVETDSRAQDFDAGI